MLKQVLQNNDEMSFKKKKEKKVCWIILSYF